MYFEWKDLTLNQSFAYSCEEFGTRTALVHGDRRWTYRQLQREVFETAAALRSIGVQKGTRVAYLMTGGPEWAFLFYAGLHLGAIMVPLNLTWVGREIEQGLKLTDAEVLVLMDEVRGKSFAAILGAQLPELAAAKPDGVRVERLPHLKRIVTLSAAGKTFPYALDFHALRAAGRNYSVQELREIAARVGPDDVSSYMLTSGSTGFPKPVVHTHNSILFNNANMADCHEIGLEDRFLHIAPTYHVAGIEIFLMPMLRGATVHIADYFEPEWAMRLIEKERITIMWGFDVHYLMMRRHPRYAAYDLSSLRKAMMGNSPGSFDEIKTMGIPHHGNIYGSTENGGAHAHFPWRHRADLQRVKYSNGMPLSFVETKIVDPDTGAVLGPNQRGEICSRGPGLFKGYYNMPEETAAAIDQDGFYHSGDYGWLDEKGFIYYRGRLKDTVKTGGENVSAREVEIVLEAEIPAVNTAMVFGVPDKQWGEAVTAMVEIKAGEKVSEEELKARCKDLMAGYKIPKRILFVQSSEWAITPTGKFNKKAMRDRALQLLGLDKVEST
jgi:fatty-acyl-CoA synthase